MPAPHQETGTKAQTEHENHNTPEMIKHLKSVVLAAGVLRAFAHPAALLTQGA
jgi:hypothetical protein